MTGCFLVGVFDMTSSTGLVVGSDSEEHNDVLQEESDGSQPLDTLTDDGEVRNDCWSIEGKCIHRSSR